MIRTVTCNEDVKDEFTRYCEPWRALPDVQKPGYAKNHLWQLVPSEPNDEDAENVNRHFAPTPEDIADCWYMDIYYIPELTAFEYRLLSYRMRERPLPWKVVEYKTKFTRQWLKIYLDKALQRLFVKMKS